MRWDLLNAIKDCAHLGMKVMSFEPLLKAYGANTGMFTYLGATSTNKCRSNSHDHSGDVEASIPNVVLDAAKGECIDDWPQNIGHRIYIPNKGFRVDL